MIWTVLLLIWLPGYLLLSVILYVPFLFIVSLFSKELTIKISKALAVNWGRQFIFFTGNKVEVIYKDKESFEKILKEPVVVISNHQSNLDIPLILGYLGKPVGFVAKKEMETWPLIGLWMKNIQCLFLDRSDIRKAVETMKAGAEKIKAGYSVMIFPEGTRSEDGEIAEFKKGSFKMATDSMVKILPVTIKGTYQAWGKGQKRIKQGKIQLIVDKPIEIASMEREELKGISEVVKNIIVENYKNS